MSFHKKVSHIMSALQSDYGIYDLPHNKQPNSNQKLKSCKHSCPTLQVRFSPVQNINQKDTLNQKHLHQGRFTNVPIIIQKHSKVKSTSANPRLTQRKPDNIKKIQPFVPIALPKHAKFNQLLLDNTADVTPPPKQIQIIIDQDNNKNKECIKKLFKKIHHLTEALADSEKERIRLKLQLDHLSRKDVTCMDHQKTINKLEAEKYRLQLENQMLKKQQKQKANTPCIETIKQIVVEKPYEVRVQIPKYIPGPQRIVEKIVQVPKYVEVEKKIPEIIVKEIRVPEVVQKQVYIDKPIYQQPIIVEKPVYIDKPVYLDRTVEVDRKVNVEVPYQVEVPVYIDRTVVDQDWMRRFHQLEDELGQLMHENHNLKSQNHRLKTNIKELQANLQILRTHNDRKNREIEFLLDNAADYNPLSYSSKKDYILNRTSSTLSNKNRPHLRYL